MLLGARPQGGLGSRGKVATQDLFHCDHLRYRLRVSVDVDPDLELTDS
jgi:hypothetical protein